MAPEIPTAQTSPKSDRLFCEAILGILSSFPRKPMHTKVEDNFVPHNLDTDLHYLEFGRGRYDVGKEELQNKKILTRLILWKLSLLLSQ
jgi:hypothetical protein